MLFETKPLLSIFNCGVMDTVIKNATIVELSSKAQLGVKLLNSALELRPGVELGSLALELRPGTENWS